MAKRQHMIPAEEGVENDESRDRRCEEGRGSEEQGASESVRGAHDRGTCEGRGTSAAADASPQSRNGAWPQSGRCGAKTRQKERSHRQGERQADDGVSGAPSPLTGRQAARCRRRDLQGARRSMFQPPSWRV